MRSAKCGVRSVECEVKISPACLNDVLTALAVAIFELAKYIPLAWLSYKELEIEVSGRLAKTRVPDLMVLGEECRAALTGKKRGTIKRDLPPPIIAIEVVSPDRDNAARDYRYKRSEYAAREILEYWIVDPQESQITLLWLVEGLYEETVYREDEEIVSMVLPEVRVELSNIFGS